jgi:hypothetical protein
MPMDIRQWGLQEDRYVDQAHDYDRVLSHGGFTRMCNYARRVTQKTSMVCGPCSK